MERNNPSIIDEKTAVAAAHVLVALMKAKANCDVINNGRSHELQLENVDPDELNAILKSKNMHIQIEYINAIKNNSHIVYASISDAESIHSLANLQISPPKLTRTQSSVPGHKHANLFSTIKKLTSAETNQSKHETYIVRKNSAYGADKTAKKFEHDWYKKCVGALKTKGALEVAEREAAIQELFRVIISDQPKTRVLIDEQDLIYVASKGVPGFKHIEKMNPKEFHDNILNGTFSGFGEIMPVALLLKEVDFRPANLCVNLYGKALKWDGDWCFPELRDDVFSGRNFDITSRTLDELPFCSNYEAFNWMDARIKNIVNTKPPAYISMQMSMNPAFRYEVNKSTLKCILLPDSLIKKVVSHNISDEEQIAELASLIIARKQQLYSSALENKSFRDFILHDESVNYLLKAFCQQLHNFKLTGKLLLIEPFVHKHHTTFPITEKIIEDFHELKNKIVSMMNKSQPTTPSSSPRKTSFLSSAIIPTVKSSPSVSSESTDSNDSSKNDNLKPKR